MHCLLLSNSVHASSRLDVGLRVPITIEKDASVGSLQVEAHSAAARAHQENEEVTTFRIELVDYEIPLGTRSRAIKATVLETSHRTVIVQNI